MLTPGDWLQRRWTRWALVSALSVLFAFIIGRQARAFLPLFVDDGFISLRYAERFAHGHGLTWNDGERVEGYSNLLWILLIAPLGRLMRDNYVLAARAWGLLGATLAAAALPWFRNERPSGLQAGLIGAAVIVATPAMAVWSIGGLEQPLLAALLAVALGALATNSASAAAEPFVVTPSLGVSENARARNWRLAVACFALLALTRPDGALFAAAAALAILFTDAPRKRLSRAARLALPTALAWGAQLVFRRLYYQDWLPNSAYAKLAFTSIRLREGAHYLSQAVTSMPILAVAPALGVALLFTKRRARAAPALAVHLVWALYVVAIGGDIFPAHRHAVPLIVTSAMLVSEAAGWALEPRPRAYRTRRAAALLGIVLLVGALQVGRRRDPEIAAAHQERWEWAGEAIGHFLKRAYAGMNPLIAVDAAGSVPYFTGFRALDMLGLNDRFLSHHRPADFGHGDLAHELGSGSYVYSRRPDLIIFDLPWGADYPNYRSGRELRPRPEFVNDYTLVHIKVDDPHEERSQIWMRREGATGVVRSPSEVRVPAVLLASQSSNPAQLGPSTVVELPLSTGRVFQYGGLALPPGRWRAEAQSRDAVFIDGSVQPGSRGGAPPVRLGDAFSLPAGGTVDLETWADPGGSRAPVLEAIIVRRLPSEGDGEARRVNPRLPFRHPGSLPE
jgi:arabinofuranosyltransferase